MRPLFCITDHVINPTQKRIRLVQSGVLCRRLESPQIEQTGKGTSLQDVVALKVLGSGYSFRDRHCICQVLVRKFVHVRRVIYSRGMSVTHASTKAMAHVHPLEVISARALEGGPVSRNG